MDDRDRLGKNGKRPDEIVCLSLDVFRINIV